MRKIIHTTLLLIFVTLMAGCNSNEIIQLNPQLNARLPKIIKAKKISIQIIDDRGNLTAGRTEGSTLRNIYIADLQTVIKTALNNALQKYGFVIQQKNPDTHITVHIINLSFVTHDPMMDGTKANCILEITAKNKKHSYTKIYRTNITEERLLLFTIPLLQLTLSSSIDEHYMNLAVNKTLNAIINDSNLYKFLSN